MKYRIKKGFCNFRGYMQFCKMKLVLSMDIFYSHMHFAMHRSVRGFYMPPLYEMISILLNLFCPLIWLNALDGFFHFVIQFPEMFLIRRKLFILYV